MTKFRVLLVDDEERIRKGLKKLLEEVIGGYQVVAEADNGKKALECLLGTNVDLIFTDIRMPVMNGLEFIQKVRGQFPQLPIFVLSGYDEYEYMRKALKNNVMDYILKPIDRIELAQSLQVFRDEAEVVRESGRTGKKEQMQEKNIHYVIRRVKDMVGERLHEEISLHDIAEEVQYSYNHLSALFKSETGQTFSDYLMGVRMQKARQLLKDTSLKIYEVGSLCGYPNSKYFISIFKEVVGVTPSQYREEGTVKK